jgi:hypothetical protein
MISTPNLVIVCRWSGVSLSNAACVEYSTHLLIYVVLDAGKQDLERLYKEITWAGYGFSKHVKPAKPSCESGLDWSCLQCSGVSKLRRSDAPHLRRLLGLSLGL